MSASVVAWDFDGVLNRNVRDGRFVWADRFEEDTGRSLAVFQSHVFAEFEAVVSGREGLRERVAGWAEATGYAPGADALIDYWFEGDMHLDPAMLALMDRLAGRGVPQVIATNNEPLRAARIECALGDRGARLFASGRMGVAKPRAAFFERITDALDVEPGAMILLDDHPANIEAAARLGWRAVHVTDASRGRVADALPL